MKRKNKNKLTIKKNSWNLVKLSKKHQLKMLWKMMKAMQINKMKKIKKKIKKKMMKNKMKGKIKMKNKNECKLKKNLAH